MTVAERRQRDRAHRRQAIITAARQMAEAEGWDAVTTRRLADQIEYSQPVLYSHFPGKGSIIDAVAVEGFVAAGYINHNPFVADGREANRAFWAAFFTAFPDLTATMDDLIQAGDRVAGRFTYRATHRGPFYGIPPTGRPIEMRSIDIWRVHDGEFAEHWDELNLLELFQQLGVIPALDLAASEATS